MTWDGEVTVLTEDDWASSLPCTCSFVFYFHFPILFTYSYHDWPQPVHGLLSLMGYFFKLPCVDFPASTLVLISLLLFCAQMSVPVLFLLSFLLAPVRPASEYSSPGRPLSCIVDENTPISTNGATPTSALPSSGGDQRAQERRVRSQRHRNYMSRTHLHTPPDLPEGYG